MKQLTSAEVRQMFLDFFKSKGHSVEPSASLVPVDDPTLLWINSGVATLKKYLMDQLFLKIPESQMHKNQFVRTILKMWDAPLVTIPCLKCWETFQSVIISKKKLFTGHGNF